MTTVTAPIPAAQHPTTPMPTTLPAKDLPAQRLARRRPATPRWWRDAAGALTWGSMLFVVALWVGHGGVQELVGWAEALDSLGRLTGLIAADLLLLQVLGMARIPFVEQAYGQDELARRHRLIGFTSVNLMFAHIVLITLGYAAGTPVGIVGTFVDLVLNYPGILLGLAGTVALCLVVVTSIRKARRKLRYESWHLIHLYGYLGAGLALPHQLWTGRDFVGSTISTVFWWGLWGTALASVIVFRLGLPMIRSLRHGLVVESVTTHDGETPATTVVMRGRDLDKLRASAGHFFQWRFLDGPGWSRAHPYSLSAAPDGRTLRITAAHLGDGSRRLAELKRGTKVFFEGPYGRLHEGVRTRRKVLLMGAGIGVAPMRALLEGLDQQPGEVTLIYRVHAPSDALFADELDKLARDKGARVLTVSGPRNRARTSWLPASAEHLSDADALRHLVPDVADHDVYLCGSPAWMAAARDAALVAGVPADRIHQELFGY